MKRPLKLQRGYSLVELSIAIAIIGVITAGALAGVQSILRSNHVNSVIKQTNVAVGRTVAKTLRQPDTSSINTTVLAGLGVWDPQDVVSGVPNHAFSGAITVGPLAAVGGYAANQSTYYQMQNIPKAACPELAIGLADLAYAMTIKDATTTPAAIDFGPTSTTAAKALGGNISLSRVNTDCNQTGTNGNVSISILVPRI